MNIKDYLFEHKLNATRTDEGLYYVIEREGPGHAPKSGEYVVVHYEGRLLDDTLFDSSYMRDEPFSFRLGTGQVIQGWELCLPLLKKGGKGRFILPNNLAYGAEGAGGVIPPFAPLLFDIELLHILDETGYREFQALQKERMREQALEAARVQHEQDAMAIAAHVQEHKLNVQYLPSGIAYAIEEAGSGPAAEKGKTVFIHYEGSLLDGSLFDSSRARGDEPFHFTLGEGYVIPGWEQGIPAFREGDKGILLIPSLLAYGPRGVGPIPPNTVLRFDIELLRVAD